MSEYVKPDEACEGRDCRSVGGHPEVKPAAEQRSSTSASLKSFPIEDITRSLSLKD